MTRVSWRILSVISIPFFLLSTAGTHAQEEKDSKLLSLQDMIVRMQSSETTYSIEPLPADSVRPVALAALFPQQLARHDSPMVVETDDGIDVVPYPYDEYEIAKLSEAEEFFRKKEFDAARAIYQALLAERPKCYLAVSHIGDTYYFAGDAATALSYFDKAIAMNPADHQLHFFRGNALFNLERFDEAVDSYINTLVLYPRHRFSMDALEKIREYAGIELHESLFAPEALAEPTDDGVSIKLDKDAIGGSWFGYAVAKGFWLGEPAHRKEVTGSERLAWSSMAEREAISALISSYLIFKKEKGENDPAIEKIIEIANNGDLDKFMLYEMASRFDPHFALRQKKQVREWMHDYVATYLVVKKRR